MEVEEEEESAEAVIYTPHGIHSSSEDLDLVTRAKPPIKTLAFLHGLEDITLGSAQQLNLGAHNGLEAQRKLNASYWIGTHDEDKKGTGLVGWLLRRKKLSVRDAVEAERKRRGRQRDLLKRSAGEPIKPVIEELPKMSEQFTAMLRMVLAE